MRKLTLSLVCVLVFSIPLEQITSIELIGSITRLLGIVAAGLGVLACIAGGRFRRLPSILILAFALASLSLLSLAWTLSYDASIQRGLTYMQLVGLVWLVWEFARTREELQLLLTAYCLGAYFSMGDLLLNFSAGSSVVGLRYSANKLDPNDFGVMLAIGIPIAWYLFLNRKGFLALASVCYVPLAAIGIPLTGSRGASLAGVVALSVIPLTSIGKSRRMFVTFIFLLVTLGAVATVVPQSSVDRIATFGAELENRQIGGRGVIWAAGLRVFLDRPLLGVGTGAYRTAVEPIIGSRSDSSHNVFLSILVELGVVGFGCFTLLIISWISLVYGLPSQERKVWFVLIGTWAVGAMSLGLEYRKNTWLLFGLVAVHAALEDVRGNARAASTAASASGNSRAGRGTPASTAIRSCP